MDYPYVFLDATYYKARVTTLWCPRRSGWPRTGGERCWAIDAGDSENEVFWTGFLRSLKARGLGGVKL
jgi:putative transposase